MGLAKYSGWWNGVVTGDFDGDGRLDIIASNWGRNTPYQSRRSRPLKLFYGDIDDIGKIDLLYTSFDPDLGAYAPEGLLGFLNKSIRFLGEKFTTHASFAKSTIQEILGDRMPRVQSLEAAWLETTLFLNRGDHFEARVLPVEAQMAPAFALCVGDFDGDDFDGDGDEDVFLSQNFFAVQPDVPRYDAGRGLLLRGDGRGALSAVGAQASGIRIYGEQRGAAACDYDGDGRLDLVVTQNGSETKLYHNHSAPVGLRIRLRGPTGNPNGIGAVLRAGNAERVGPAREVHAGSGYWSQDSAVQIFAPRERIRKVQVRWPGSSEWKATDVPAEAREVAIDIGGKSTVLR